MSSAIERWSSSAVDAPVVSFAKSVVAAVSPTHPARARSLLFAASRLAAFAVSVGLELDPAVVLHPSVLERFIVTNPAAWSDSTVRTVRTNVRHLGAAIVPDQARRPVPLSRERAKAPYTDAEICAFLTLCDTQPTESRRLRASALICLGAGAGLLGAELRPVRGTDIGDHHGTVVVTVRGGRRPRTVPVLARFSERLVDAALHRGDGFVIGGVDPDRRNVTDHLVTSLAGGTGPGRLSIARLRSTWLAACAQAIGLRAFMDAAGISCSQRLGDVVGGLPAASLDEMVAHLRGSG